MRGHVLDEPSKQGTKQSLSEDTGRPVETVFRADLRISPLLFRKKLLKRQGKVPGTSSVSASRLGKILGGSGEVHRREFD